MLWETLSKVYHSCPNTSLFGLSRDPSHLFTPLPRGRCGREWARPHQALFSVPPQHVWPQAVS